MSKFLPSDFRCFRGQPVLLPPRRVNGADEGRLHYLRRENPLPWRGLVHVRGIIIVSFAVPQIFLETTGSYTCHADTDSYCTILTNQNTTTIFMKILGLSSFDIGLAHLVASLKENIQSSKPLFQKEKLVAN